MGVKKDELEFPAYYVIEQTVLGASETFREVAYLESTKDVRFVGDEWTCTLEELNAKNYKIIRKIELR